MFLPVEPSTSSLRVLLADDHHFFREGLRAMLTEGGMTVVGEVDDGARAVRLARELSPDVVVIDLKMPGAPGLEAVREIAARQPSTRLVVLTVSSEERDAWEALGAGACCYLTKDTRGEELVGAIRLASVGHSVLPGELTRALVAHVHLPRGASVAGSDGHEELTAREREVLRLIAQGANNAAIGRELSISAHTVKQYVTNILKKLDVQTRVEAAVYAVRNGLA